ncbi:hypothetical protein [Streptomyces sp. NBC_01497]|uniref:hypothetical protein n=1 Tax=Streptomyces sp. NBC_01497 TaxID=2903885 RepID=UPI002E34D072|nr:hypothetical protein [Streptomyces sp. NBC_01497]
MTELLEAVREGRVPEVADLLERLDPAGRKTELAALKALRAEVRSWQWDRWREREGIRSALLVAGAGCHTGAAAAAAWIGGRDLRQWRGAPVGTLLRVLRHREPEWLGDVAGRLAVRTSTAQEDFPLILELCRAAGRRLPVSDGTVRGWAMWHMSERRPLLEGLLRDPEAAAMVPLLFVTEQLPLRADSPHDWPAALAALAAGGTVPRGEVLDACVARLLRGGRPNEQAFFLAVLSALAPDGDERAARITDWMGMASDAAGPVAAMAQTVLAGLAGSGDLPPTLLADLSAAVFFRPEKKLVRSQLTLVRRVLVADRSTAAVLLPVLAESLFGHTDTGLQERALALVGRHLADVDEEVRERIAVQAGELAPVHRRAAAALFGRRPDDDDAEPYEEVLPVPFTPGPLPDPPWDVRELAAEVATAVGAPARGPDGDGLSAERLLDGLVRHAYRDPDALRMALAESLAGTWLVDDELHRVFHTHQLLHSAPPIQVVAGSLLGRVGTQALSGMLESVPETVHAPSQRLATVLRHRAWEVAHRVRTRTLPFLLATPTDTSGSLDAAVLVERLRQFAGLGTVPAPLDLAQALLRVARAGAPATVASARALGTPEGDRLADWLSAGEAPLPALVVPSRLEPDMRAVRRPVRQAPVHWVPAQAGADDKAAVPGLGAPLTLTRTHVMTPEPETPAVPFVATTGGTGMRIPPAARPPADADTGPAAGGASDRARERPAGTASEGTAGGGDSLAAASDAVDAGHTGDGRAVLHARLVRVSPAEASDSEVPTAPSVLVPRAGAGSGAVSRDATAGVATGAGRAAVRPGEPVGDASSWPPAFRWLDTYEISAPTAASYGTAEDPALLAVLPQDMESTAGLLRSALLPMPRYDGRPGDAAPRGSAWWLPLLAEKGGTPGPSVHRALAHGLGSRHPEDRLAAIDALLMLAARGLLDGRSVGTELGPLVVEGVVKLNRLADALRTTARTGAYATVWTVLTGVLPVVLTDVSSLPRAGEILSVAADCVERCGAQGEVAGLAQVRERQGTSQLKTQANRLLTALRP